jgi:hypothetical protein
LKPVLTIVLLIACPPLAGGQPTKVQLKLLPQETIQQRLETVVPATAARRATLQSLFEEVGCSDERLVSQNVSMSRFPNLICTMPGNDPDAGMIVAGAHFDQIGGGIGAVDDWSGAVLLPSLYQSLAARERRHTFVFACFSAEHKGMDGSNEFVYRLSKRQRAKTRAMMNLESLGLTVPLVWASRADKGLLEACSSVARTMDLDLRVSNFTRFMDDDSRPFLEAKIPVITIHSVTSQTVWFHYGSRDQLSAIDPNNYYQTYRLAATFLAYLDALPD